MKLARIYFDMDLRCAFEGFRKFLKEEKIDHTKLGKGDLIVFINRSRTMFKMLAGDHYLVSYSNGQKRIPLDAIQYLPLYFDGTQLEFTKAIEKSIREKLRIFN